MEQYFVWWRVWPNHQYPTLLRVRAVLCVALALALAAPYASYAQQGPEPGEGPWTGFDHVLLQHSQELLQQGRHIFRFDTFGDQAFWGDMLQLHQAIAGQTLGGVGPGVSPKTALGLGLKVDVDALPPDVVEQLQQGQVNLEDPAVTVLLLQANAVVGVTGFFQADGHLQSMGIQCALCHSQVDDSLTAGIGHRLDGWPNRDLNVGAIIALAPNLQPFADLLGTDQDTVRDVLTSWGPGKFDAELLLDGKAFNPLQVTDGVVTGRQVPGATLLPPAFGLAGVNLHTWTGWGSVPHWNAFVAILAMHGQGTFVDPRLTDPVQFPIAAREGFAHVRHEPDLVTSKLPALHFYQLALPAPAPPPGSFDTQAATRGATLFSGKGQCSTCHVEPLGTEPGWNLHTPEEMCIDAFQANRAPDKRYRTAPLNGLWTHITGGFYHDGRFPTLLAVVAHYNTCFSLGLTAQEENDLVEYLKSLPASSASGP
jgi:hypothetical protein